MKAVKAALVGAALTLQPSRRTNYPEELSLLVRAPPAPVETGRRGVGGQASLGAGGCWLPGALAQGPRWVWLTAGPAGSRLGAAAGPARGWGHRSPLRQEVPPQSRLQARRSRGGLARAWPVPTCSPAGQGMPQRGAAPSPTPCPRPAL